MAIIAITAMMIVIINYPLLTANYPSNNHTHVAQNMLANKQDNCHNPVVNRLDAVDDDAGHCRDPLALVVSVCLTLSI